MLISEVSKICNITKKAISYYEQQGLLDLKYSENGYRKYSEYDIAILKEITIYRKLGLSVPDIKLILTSKDKSKALHDFKFIKEFCLQQEKAQFDCFNYLLESESSIEEAFNEVGYKLDANMTIKDKLLLAFPGNYGLYLYFHFGKFFDEKIDTNDKIIAYNRIVEFLDNIGNLEFPEDLQVFLADSFDALSRTHLKKMAADFDSIMNDLDNYLEVNHESVVGYLEYRNSDDFKASPAYRMQQILVEFQESSGYYDIFISNLKIISSSYRTYLEKLHVANEKFISRFPQR